MRSILYLILLAFSGAAMASPAITYNNWVKGLPSCMRPCFNDYFDNIAKGKCGSGAAKSSKPSDINCICQSGSFGSSRKGSAINRCVVARCRGAADQLGGALQSYTQLCLAQVNSDGSVPRSQGSAVVALSDSDVVLLGGLVLLQAML